MRHFFGYFWLAAIIAIWFNCKDVSALESRYSPALSKMVAEFNALKGITDQTEIRQKHSAMIKSFGNFSVDPCEDLFKFSCSGHLRDISSEGDHISYTQYQHEQLKYLLKDILLSDYSEFQNEAERKAKVFFDSCVSYQPTEEDFATVAKKFFAIIDGAENWKEAYIPLHKYGLNFFLNFSSGDLIFPPGTSQQLSSKTLEDLKNSVRMVSAINEDPDRDVDSISQKIFDFGKTLEDINLQKYYLAQIVRNANGEYPALILGKFFIYVAAAYNKGMGYIGNEKFLVTWNNLMESTNLETLKYIIKVIVYDRLRSIEKFFDVPQNVKVDRCLDATHAFFEPGLQSLYIKNLIPEQSISDLNKILEDILEAYKTMVMASPKLDSEQKRKVSSTLNGRKYTIDRFVMIYEKSYLDSLYDYLDVSSPKPFFDLYFDVVDSYNKKKIQCISDQRSYQKTPENYRTPDRFKPHLLCRGNILEEFPLPFLNFPYYNAAYAKFWNYGAFSHAFLRHIPIKVEPTIPLDQTDITPWDVFDATYMKYANDGDELTGYEDLNLTTPQLFYVAHVQAACNQIVEEGTNQYINLSKQPALAKAFNCPI